MREKIERILTKLFEIAYSKGWRLAYLDSEMELIAIPSAQGAALWLMDVCGEELGVMD